MSNIKTDIEKVKNDKFILQVETRSSKTGFIRSTEMKHFGDFLNVLSYIMFGFFYL